MGLRIAQLVMPSMRERISGTIVDITSVRRCMAGPLGAWNHGTKLALEGMIDRLRVEVIPFGIGVVVIEPNAIRTEIAEVAVDPLRAESGSGPYGPLAKAIIKSMANEDLERRQSPPTGNCRRNSSGNNRAVTEPTIHRRFHNFIAAVCKEDAARHLA